MDGNRGLKRRLVCSKDPDYDFDHDQKRSRPKDEDIKNSNSNGSWLQAIYLKLFSILWAE